VDYVMDFKMVSYTDDVASAGDVSFVVPATPDAVLVSAHSHHIIESA
jgi:hypothetical protein